METTKALYQEGILHRDIKAKNFIYDSLTKKLTLIDFGLAVETLTGQYETHELSGP